MGVYGAQAETGNLQMKEMDKMIRIIGLIISSLIISCLLLNVAYADSLEGTWHGERAGVKFFPSGENLAYDKPAPTIHPKLTEHSQKMVPGVYQVA